MSNLKPIHSWPHSELREIRDFKNILNLPNVKESPFYEKLRGLKVRCKLCNRFCVLDHGQVSSCGVRFNFEGKLYTVTYGLLTAVESRPMEIKPFFHFNPATTATTISTWGCNFVCAWCQNYTLSKYVKYFGHYISPEKLVEWCLDIGDDGINVSLNEPTLLTEYALDVFKTARKHNLHLSYNTNGYMSLEVLKELVYAGMQAVNIDVKGWEDTYRRWLLVDFDKYWRNVVEAEKMGLHVELTYLVIPKVNDDEIESFLERASKDLDLNTPIHFTRFHPDHKLLNTYSTPIEVLEEARNLAVKHYGFNYAYIGNVPGHPYEHTYCPKCGKIVIKRYGMYVVDVKLEVKNSKYVCRYCGSEVLVRGRLGRKFMRGLSLII